MEFDVRQRFGQAVSNHLGGGHVRQLNPSSRYLIPNVIVLDINMFGP